jgi:hypothetical protein
MHDVHGESVAERRSSTIDDADLLIADSNVERAAVRAGAEILDERAGRFLRGALIAAGSRVEREGERLEEHRGRDGALVGRGQPHRGDPGEQEGRIGAAQRQQHLVEEAATGEAERDFVAGLERQSVGSDHAERRRDVSPLRRSATQLDEEPRIGQRRGRVDRAGHRRVAPDRRDSFDLDVRFGRRNHVALIELGRSRPRCIAAGRRARVHAEVEDNGRARLRGARVRVPITGAARPARRQTQPRGYAPRPTPEGTPTRHHGPVYTSTRPPGAGAALIPTRSPARSSRGRS